MKERQIALIVLGEITQEGAYANKALEAHLENAEDNTTRFVRRVVYGVLDHQEELDARIDRANRSKRKRLDPVIRNILRLSVYQLLYMDRTPSHAILHEAVEMAKKKNPRYGGFVNGLLRSIDRGESLNSPLAFPPVIQSALVEDYSESEISALYESVQEVPHLCVRRNPLRISKEAFIERFAKTGMELTESLLTEDVYRVSNPVDLFSSELYREGLFSVQDEAAAGVVVFADPKPGERWLDLCAAPGGKTMQLAERMRDSGHVTACDLYPQKVDTIKEHASRLGLDAVQPEVRDATVFHPDFESAFDGVLVDAPCSGLGLLRRKPDIKHHRTAEQMAEVEALQKAILDRAARYVKPGGVLVYSTCTIRSAENKKQVQAFLARHENFKPEGNPHEKCTDMVATMADGFYMAKLRKIQS